MPKNAKQHDEDVDGFIPDEDEMTEVSEYESVEGPAKTFSTIDRITTIRLFTTPILVAVMVAIIAVLMTLFYFVPLWDPVGHLDRMKMRIAMQDTGYTLPDGVTTLNFGELFMHTVLNTPETKDLLGWEFVTGYKASAYTRERIESDVTHQKYWAGLIIPQNYTRDMVTAYVAGIDASATYSNPIVYIRDQTLQYTTSTIIDRTLNAVISSFDTSVRKFFRTNMTRAASAPAKVVFNPIYLDSITIHSIGVMGEYFSHYVPFVVIWICMMTVLWAMRTSFRSDYMIGNFALTKHKKYTWYLVVVGIAGFFVSTCIALFLDGLGVPMKEGVVAMLFLYWFTAFTFAGFINLFMALLGAPALAIVTIILVFQLVTSDGIYAAKTMAGNFKGATPVFPFSHAVQLARTLLLGTALNNRGLHVVVMLIWMVGSWVIAPILDYFNVGKKVASAVLPVNLKGYYHFVQMI